MTKSYLTNIHTGKVIAKNVIFQNLYNKKKHVQKQAIWRSNTKKSKSTLIRAADVLFYNHAYVKAFNGKFINIWLKLFKYSLGVSVSQSSTKLRGTYFKENLFLGNLPKVSPDLMIRYDTYFFSYNFVLRAQP